MVTTLWATLLLDVKNWQTNDQVLLNIYKVHLQGHSSALLINKQIDSQENVMTTQNLKYKHLVSQVSFIKGCSSH